MIRRQQERELSHNTDEPPWDPLNREAARQTIGAVGRHDGLNSYKQLERLRSPLDLTVFSDGSLDQNENAAAGYCVYRGSQEILLGQIPLGKTALTYDAEIIGATEGLRAACSHWMARFAKNVIVCIDNEEAAIRLHTNRPTPSSSTHFSDFHLLCGSWAHRERALGIEVGTVQIRWVPGHKGISGNERADNLAKNACSMTTSYTKSTIARAKRALEERYQENLVAYWNLHAPRRYKDLEIRMVFKASPELLNLPRRSLGMLLAARSGHGDFAAYHRRFNHTKAELHCSCGQEKAPEHPFFCRLTRRNIRRFSYNISRSTQENIKWTLSTSTGANAFHKRFGRNKNKTE